MQKMINYCAFKECTILYWGHIISVDAKLSSGSYFCIIFRSYMYISVQFSSIAQSCLTLCDPMDCRTPGVPVHHQLLELIQTHVHHVGDAIQPSHPLSSPFLPVFNLSQLQVFSNESVLCIRWPKYGQSIYSDNPNPNYVSCRL